MRHRAWTAELALIAIVAVWGWTFVAVKEAIEEVPVFTFLAGRFTIAAVAFIPWILWSRRSTPSVESPPSTPVRKPVVVAGIAIGALLAIGYALQTFGLALIDSGRSGVITGVSTALVPLGAWLILRQRVRAGEWIGVLLALAGFALLGFGDAPLGFGDLLVFGCAVAFAGHVVALGQVARDRPVLPLAFTQVATAAASFTILALFVDGPGAFLEISTNAVEALLITGLVATTLGFSVQTWAQSVSSPTRIVLIIALEPVFAIAAGVIWNGEALSLSILCGAGLVIGGMLCAELSPRAESANSTGDDLEESKEESREAGGPSATHARSSS